MNKYEKTPEPAATKPSSGRLSKAERRRQLLDTVLVIIREEGADRLTLGHLAVRAGVSKPITYEHFNTRAGLLTNSTSLLTSNRHCKRPWSMSRPTWKTRQVFSGYQR
ncbi:TetR/AcrR family transcriptional regulator [Sodalis sp. RH21]|uniref:TetR/AcrR family transcriptional regulator n=1 Tax=unclassified Sodalis (in: enterobacteria) TaxID=2636512 RepID=UPI0039B6CA38